MFSRILTTLLVLVAGTAVTRAKTPYLETTSNLATIRGVVREAGGEPIGDATVAIFRVGTSQLLKQVRSSADGRYLAKIIPGTYTILAVAQGFNPTTLPKVEVAESSLLDFGFKLERSGSGNTLPEKRVDRNNPKWAIRSAQTSRSVYQNTEGDAPDVEVAETASSAPAEDDREVAADRRPHGAVETYFASSDNGVFSGVNFATLFPAGSKAEIIVAGQTGIGAFAPQRFELGANLRPTDQHQIRLKTAVGKLGSITLDGRDETVGQFSVQALDEWKVREGVIVVFGVDYSRLLGAGNDFSLTPRFGFQFDIDAKTRFRSSYAVQTEERSWAHAIELEDAQVLFNEPFAITDIAVESGQPQLRRSRRLEFGIERVLDGHSTLEANVFFDATAGRGIGLMSLPINGLDGNSFNEFTGTQNGSATGMRVVYTRRLGSRFSTAAGYSFGSGQRLSPEALSEPADLFENDFFQSFFGQFEADLRTGTNVKTVFRLSPSATIFAIDPFQGRLAIYDPSLSVLVTQNLPTLGLPFRAEAVVDARNLFGFATGVTGESGTLRVNSQNRAIRGGILVRF